MSEQIVDEVPKRPDPVEMEMDWCLSYLVEVANQSDSAAGISITLTLPGFLVSGELVSGRVYTEGMVADINDRAGLPAEIKEAFIGRMFGPLIGQYLERSSEDSDAIKEWHDIMKNEDGTEGNIAFLHLKNASFFSGGAAPISNAIGTFWRGRISQVCGWSFGKIEAVD